MQKNNLLFAGALTLMASISACAPAGTKSNESGLEAYSSGDYTNAVYLFKQAATQKPSEGVYYCNLGQAYCALGDYGEALESFQRAIELGGNLFYSYRGMAMAYAGLKEYDQAVSGYDQALEAAGGLDSSFRLDVLGYRAEAKTAQGDYDGALNDYQEMIDSGYRLRDIYQLRGDVYLLKGDVDGALHSYQECLNIDNRDYEGYLTMAEKLKNAGAYFAREIVLNAALEVIPREAVDWCYRGRIFLELDQQDEAFAAFEESYNKGYTPAGYYLGFCYELRGEEDEAMLLYQEQLKDHPDDAGLYNQIAACLIRQKEYEDALIMLKKGLSLAEGDMEADILWNECICYEKSRDYDTAIEKLMSYLERYSSDSEAEKELTFLFSR